MLLHCLPTRLAALDLWPGLPVVGPAEGIIPVHRPRTVAQGVAVGVLCPLPLHVTPDVLRAVTRRATVKTLRLRRPLAVGV
jgi:hypothetical protein